ncbi:MAG: hypothetical protein RL721_2364 [Candidatus Eisenbacteria bacterium]
MPISIVVPQLGESVAEGTVARWLKAVGDKVRKEEPLVEIQTDKINVEIPSPAEGVLAAIVVPEGTTAAAPAAAKAAAGAPVAVAAPPAAPAVPAAPATNGAAAHANESAEGRNLSPAVRKLMREHNVAMSEIDGIRGSGVAGRVTRDDLMAYLKQRTAAPAAAAAVAAPVAAPAAAPAAPASVPSFLRGSVAGVSASGPREETVQFTRVRKVIADNMVKAKHTAAHTHCFDECDMSAVVALRKEWAPRLEAQGVKLTYMPFFIKAACFALKEFPWMNSSVTPAGDALTLKRYYNIGIAVGRDEKGLIVPNLKDCDRKNLVQLAAEVNDLASRARADRLGPDDIQGGTFSITNAGVFGAINSSPVINVPEVAILGVHKIVDRPVVRNGQIVIAPVMNTSIGFDHRVVDGELAVKFLRRVCELLERPELLWFHA